MYQYGGASVLVCRGQCISMEGASVWVRRGPMYGYGGGQCMGMEGASVWVWREPVYEYGGGLSMSMEGPSV